MVRNIINNNTIEMFTPYIIREYIINKCGRIIKVYK